MSAALLKNLALIIRAGGQKCQNLTFLKINLDGYFLVLIFSSGKGIGIRSESTWQSQNLYLSSMISYC